MVFMQQLQKKERRPGTTFKATALRYAAIAARVGPTEADLAGWLAPRPF
jgi:hypothetical protein